MTRLSLTFLLSAALMACTAHGRELQPKGFVLANNYLGFNLLNQFAAENDQKSSPNNIFFSPYSISVAMAMLHQGAGGSTAKQLESQLGYKLAKLNQADKGVLAREVQESNKVVFLPEGNTSYALKTGNALFVDKNFQLLDSYKQSLQDNFQAEAFQLDFGANPTAAMNQINQWGAEKTNQKIKTILDQPPSDATKLALLNAVYFKGSWKRKFDGNKTKPGTFTGLSGAKFENVQFMHDKDRYRVANLNELDADLVELPYQGEELSLYAILPRDPKADLAQVRSAISPWFIESAISRAFSNTIKIKFPKFKFDTNYDLVGTLKALGITEIFGDKADLSGLTGNAAKLVVGEAKHKAVIEVNEEGTEAAAITHIGVMLMSARVPHEDPRYDFDHPFVFLIRHNTNGQVLFIGEVNKF